MEQISPGKVDDSKRYPHCSTKISMKFFYLKKEKKLDEPKNNFVQIRRNRCCTPRQWNISITTTFNFIQINDLNNRRDQ